MDQDQATEVAVASVMIEEEPWCLVSNLEESTALSDGLEATRDDIIASTIWALGQDKIMFGSLTRKELLFYLKSIAISSVQVNDGTNLAINVDGFLARAVLTPVVRSAVSKSYNKLTSPVIFVVFLSVFGIFFLVMLLLVMRRF